MVLADKRSAASSERNGRGFPEGDSWRHDGYSEELVSGLTPSVINRMDRGELIEVLHALPAPFLRSESLSRLQHWDMATLRRVVHLACRCQQPQYY